MLKGSKFDRGVGCARSFAPLSAARLIDCAMSTKCILVSRIINGASVISTCAQPTEIFGTKHVIGFFDVATVEWRDPLGSFGRARSDVASVATSGNDPTGTKELKDFCAFKCRI